MYCKYTFITYYVLLVNNMNRTSEISIFIHSDHQGRGLGRILMNETIRIAHEMRFRCIIGNIAT
jgi:L-amino acid N-acyltransferase YncA